MYNKGLAMLPWTPLESRVQTAEGHMSDVSLTCFLFAYASFRENVLLTKEQIVLQTLMGGLSLSLERL